MWPLIGAADFGVAQIEFCAVDSGLGSCHAGLRSLYLRRLRIELGLRDGILRHERLDPPIFRLRQCKRRLGSFEFRLRGVECDLIRCLFDHEQQVAFVHAGAVFEENLLQVAVDPRSEIDGRRRVGAADELDRVSYRLLDWLRDGNLRRRRRDELVLRLAAAQDHHGQPQSDREPRHPLVKSNANHKLSLK